MTTKKRRAAPDDGYGLQRTEWRIRMPPSGPLGDISPVAAEARRAAFSHTSGRLAADRWAARAAEERKAEEARRAEAIKTAQARRLAEEVESVANSLACGSVRLPSSSCSLTFVSRDEAPPMVSHVTLWPLQPMSVEEAVKCGVLTWRGVNTIVYERLVAERFAHPAVDEHGFEGEPPRV